MGRKRVLALGPALSRMRFAHNLRAYEKIQGAPVYDGRSHESSSSCSRSSSRFFWGRWSRPRKKPAAKSKLKLGGGDKKKSGAHHVLRGRLRGFKVSKLRIVTLVSPGLLLLKKLRDSYVRMILALERDCGEYGGALAMSNYPMYPIYLFA